MLPDRPRMITSSLLKKRQKISELLSYASENVLPESVISQKVGTGHSKDARFKVMKSTLRQRLLNTCFHLDFSRTTYSDYFQQIYENDRLTFIAKTLVSLGARQTSVQIAERAYKQAEMLEHSTNAVDLSLLLRQSALLRGDEKKHAFYTKQINRWLGVRAAELRLEGLFDELRIGYARRATPRKQELERAFDASELARSLMKQHPTFNVKLFAYRILTLNAQTRGDYAVCIELCNEAEAYIGGLPQFTSDVRLAEFAIKRLVCSVHLRNLKEGTKAAEVCERAFKPATNNWYVYLEQFFLLNTASGNFEQAQKIWDQVNASYNFANQPESRKDRWTIFSLYLHLMKGSLSASLSIPFKHTLTFREFVTGVSSTSVDKTGFNFSLILLHVLYLIQERQWAALLDRLEAVKSYRTRHLRNKNSQAAAFIKLLLDLEKRNFQPGTSNNMEFQSLEGTIDTSVLEGLQIIPFDHLWSWVQRQLAKGAPRLPV